MKLWCFQVDCKSFMNDFSKCWTTYLVHSWMNTEGILEIWGKCCEKKFLGNLWFLNHLKTCYLRYTKQKLKLIFFRTLGQDLAAAYGDTSLSDVTLVCEGRVFSAHKIILSMRSKYFRAMFAHPATSENQVR